MEWSLLYLAKYPDVQEKIFQEIDRITDDGNRNVRLSDKEQAHYTVAFIDEVTRHCPFASMPPSHKTLEDVRLQGKFIPKNTQVYILLFMLRP